MGIENVRPLTLRKLKWQADAKRRHDFDVAISLTVYISDMIGGQFDPIKSNPYRDETIHTVPQSDKRRKQQANNGIMALGMALKQIAKNKPKKKK